MNTPTTSLLLISLTLCLSSCAKKEEEPTPEPITPPVRRAAPPAPIAGVNPTDPFRTPGDDTNLPTDSQLADGEASSIGIVIQPGSTPAPNNGPSASITPAPVSPPSKPTPPKDELAPEQSQ